MSSPSKDVAYLQVGKTTYRIALAPEVMFDPPTMGRAGGEWEAAAGRIHIVTGDTRTSAAGELTLRASAIKKTERECTESIDADRRVSLILRSGDDS
jgi:hypothetical protein